MRPVRRLTILDQTVVHIRKGIREGRWSGPMPGVLRLSAELDVSKDTLQAALRTLEKEGLIISHGHGRRREVAPGAAAEVDASGVIPKRSLRIGILPKENPAKESAFTQRLLLQLEHDIEAAGHLPFFASQSQASLQFDVARIGAMIEETPADLWIVMSGFQDLMVWFKNSEVPVFAIGGRADDLGLPSASSTAEPAIREATQRLIMLGHRRIVMVAPRSWKMPSPGRMMRTFLNELTAAGISTGEFNVPDWDETPEGFQLLLESLFRLTPPTAILVEDARQAFALQSFLLGRGLRVPRDLSVICRIDDPAFAWCRPRLAHFHYDETLTVRRAVRWINALAKGRPDNERVLFPLEFVQAETIAPPSKP